MRSQHLVTQELERLRDDLANLRYIFHRYCIKHTCVSHFPCHFVDRRQIDPRISIEVHQQITNRNHRILPIPNVLRNWPNSSVKIRHSCDYSWKNWAMRCVGQVESYKHLLAANGSYLIGFVFDLFFSYRNMQTCLKPNVLAWSNCRIWARSVCRSSAFHWDHVCEYCRRRRYHYVKIPRYALYNSHLHRRAKHPNT